MKSRTRKLSYRRHVVANRNWRYYDFWLRGAQSTTSNLCGPSTSRHQPVLLDGDGNEITGDGVEGYLCVKHPWPSMLRTTYGDHERCKNVYFSNYEGHYFTGDGARREDGMFRIIGRVDDVINVSGHRFGTPKLKMPLMPLQ